MPSQPFVVAVAVAMAAATAASSPRLDVDLSPVAGGRAMMTITITADGSQQPSPINVAFVVDRSSSIDGARLAAAQRATQGALATLGPGDVGSLVAYGPTVDVLLEATPIGALSPVGVEPQLDAGAELPSLAPQCESALFAGISKGIRELRQYQDGQDQGGGRVDRVLLISDGLANIGPASADELEALGRSLRADGIAVSTFDLGDEGEELMMRLAAASHGNHYRVAAIDGLGAALEAELDALRRVGLRRAELRIDCADGVVPIGLTGGNGSTGSNGEIVGSSIAVSLGAIARDRPASVSIELELAAAPLAGPVARVRATVDDVTVGRRELAAEVHR